MQFTLQGILGGFVSLSVALTLRSELSRPGEAAVAILVFAVLVAIFHRTSQIAWQLVIIAYLCLLLELLSRGISGYQVLQFANYWGTIGPMLQKLAPTFRVLLPFWSAVALLVRLRCGPCRNVFPRCIWFGIGSATIGVLLAFLAVHLVCWFGFPRGDYNDWQIQPVGSIIGVSGGAMALAGLELS